MIFTWKEVARVIGVNPRTLKRWNKIRKLSFQKTSPCNQGRIFTTKEDIFEWMFGLGKIKRSDVPITSPIPVMHD